ncbi:N-acetylmuramoyl-L-alanine amidase [Luteimonas sp. MC1825]|uniref:N-acetylmuramoyl-L-alanine amidase n=1 Tax=Luteimonas sp. MC1825 TaxID=2761107 RepID=UPI00162001F6|nr:N-acetylmuramoyl-L-alanine amidase [Luteimonas sp. MC1825]MBB6598960.1 N-acetylmuramoyl-L-alanine amidase [Luteimonas sp. MC1825]QOC89099.1 N-acetylmuramoyl-L-alanine amidase [Luteimonas sp. MC1825]
MRARGINLQQILLGAALLAALLWNLAHAAEIKGLRVDTGPTGTRAELQLDAQAEFKLITLANPDRLVVDLPGSRLARGFSLPAAVGVVKAVRNGQPVPGTTRIVFDLASPVVVLNPRIEAAGTGSRLVLEWPGDLPGDPIAKIAAATQAAPGPTAATQGPGAVPQVTAPVPDPSAASAAATSRLIAGLPPVAKPPAAAVPQAQPARSTPQESAPRVLPSVPTTVATGVPTRVTTPEAATPTPPPANRPATAATGRPLVIAIDAGHGGQDPGAVGPTGKREKDITLAIARELARQVNATPGLKAHLVRDVDVFIPLNRRAQLARAAGADLFISIHADAAENRNAKGSSVYVLSLKGASSQRARWLADKENAADLIGGGKLPTSDSMLTNVLLDLTQSGQMKASEDAGNHILAGLKRIGNNHKPHIERANFAVLRTSDMPAMLVETAFLSNPEEEKRLIDPAFQANVARAVLDGVKTYFTSQPPPGTLFAARAASTQAAGAAGGGSP